MGISDIAVKIVSAADLAKADTGNKRKKNQERRTKNVVQNPSPVQSVKTQTKTEYIRKEFSL